MLLKLRCSFWNRSACSMYWLVSLVQNLGSKMMHWVGLVPECRISVGLVMCLGWFYWLV